MYTHRTWDVNLPLYDAPYFVVRTFLTNEMGMPSDVKWHGGIDRGAARNSL